MSDLLYIDQTLHGYADGHQLLATSLDLSSDQQSVLLIMSDLSGPAFRTGYETYLTGYPLPGGKLYALARTWFAPELPRPGCVWTQTLLIRVEDLARILAFQAVNNLFQRPVDALEIGGYRRRLILNDQNQTISGHVGDGRAVLRALYGSDRRVVVSSESSQSCEPLVFAIFEQQWPRLRRGFRFCTGALSVRDSDFELSVSPPEATHSLSKDGLVVSRKDLGRFPSEEWLDAAGSDLQAAAHPRSEYRAFLWRFGPDFSEPRGAFRPLTEVHCLLQTKGNPTQLDQLLSAVSHFYPEPRSALRLKTSIFGPEPEYVPAAMEPLIVRLLVSHPGALAIASTTADLRLRARRIVSIDIDAAAEIAILAIELGGEHAEEFLRGFFENVDWPSEFIETVSNSLLASLLAKQPDLVAHTGLWLRSDRIDLVGLLLSEMSADDRRIKRSLSAMIDAGAWDAVSRSMSLGGAAFVAGMLSLIDGDSSSLIAYPDSLYSEIAKRNDAWSSLVQSGSLGPRCLNFLSADLDPRSWYVRKLDLNYWSDLLVGSFRFETSGRALRSSVFCLSVGLSSWRFDAARFVSHAFAQVYAAVAANEVDDVLWSQLEPNLSWYNPGWDRCARLTRTVAWAFKERSWPLEQFFMTFSSDGELVRALNEIRETYGGPRFIREARHSVMSGATPASAHQREIMMLIDY